MENEKNLTSDSTPTESVQDTNIDYIEAIKELKANTVPKEDYDKLKAENKKLVGSLINGETVNVPKEDVVDVKELRNTLFNGETEFTNLEYITNVLKLRNTLIDKGEKDPFLPYGHSLTPTAQDVEAANRVASVLQECIDYAQGDSGLFTAELQRRMIDSTPMRGKK